MNNTPKFFGNLWGDLQGNLETSVWNEVTKAWDEKRHLDSFYTLLDYINPKIRQNYANGSQTEFQVPHGSVVVNISLKNDNLEINCPLVDTSEAIQVPLMRKVAELNFHPLSLAQIKLAANKLTFHYNTTLDVSEPYKIYYVFKEICQTADRYDDEFREKFKAKNLVEPKVRNASASEVDTAWQQCSDIIKETQDYLVYFDSQRWYGSSLDFIIIALKRIDLCIQVQGHLKNEIERVIGEMGNGNLNINERLVNGKKFLQQTLDQGKEVFAKNLYESDTFIPEKWRTSSEQVKKNIEATVNTVKKYHNDKNYIGSAIESLYLIYDLFYQNNMDKEVNDILLQALDKAAGQSWQDASGILLEGLQNVSNIPVKNN